MILLIDNYDSFVYNLARYVRELGEEAVVRRHDATTLEEIAALGPSHIIISPGPRSPAEAGISTEVVRRFRATTPILGVCLGHQCVGAAYGAAIVQAARPMHGKASDIRHDGRGVFAGLPNPFRAARYHSLAVALEGLPRELRVTATAEDGEIMAIAHARDPVIGLQFHPESVLTEHGYRLLDRFLKGAAARGELLPDRADGARSLPDAEGREHAREHVVGRHDADQLVERADRGSEVRRRGGRLDPLRPRRTEAVDLAERALERQAVAGARHHGLDVSSSEQAAERSLGETALESVEPFAVQRGHKRDRGRGTGDG